MLSLLNYSQTKSSMFSFLNFQSLNLHLTSALFVTGVPVVIANVRSYLVGTFGTVGHPTWIPSLNKELQALSCGGVCGITTPTPPMKTVNLVIKWEWALVKEIVDETKTVDPWTTVHDDPRGANFFKGRPILFTRAQICYLAPGDEDSCYASVALVK